MKERVLTCPLKQRLIVKSLCKSRIKASDREKAQLSWFSVAKERLGRLKWLQDGLLYII